MLRMFTDPREDKQPVPCLSDLQLKHRAVLKKKEQRKREADFQEDAGVFVDLVSVFLSLSKLSAVKTGFFFPQKQLKSEFVSFCKKKKGPIVS